MRYNVERLTSLYRGRAIQGNRKERWESVGGGETDADIGKGSYGTNFPTGQKWGTSPCIGLKEESHGEGDGVRLTPGGGSEYKSDEKRG